MCHVRFVPFQYVTYMALRIAIIRHQPVHFSSIDAPSSRTEIIIASFAWDAMQQTNSLTTRGSTRTRRKEHNRGPAQINIAEEEQHYSRSLTHPTPTRAAAAAAAAVARRSAAVAEEPPRYIPRIQHTLIVGDTNTADTARNNPVRPQAAAAAAAA